MNLYDYKEVDPNGRRLRDAAKASFEAGNIAEEWHNLASRAVTTDALTNGLASREYAASVAMRARLGQRYELAGNKPYGEDDILESFRVAIAQLRQPLKPDQYEINFLPAAALREATHGSRLRAAQLISRAAVISFLSESPHFTREINPDLTTKERMKAKARSIGRTGIATIAALRGPKILESTTFTRNAAKYM